MYTQRHRRYLQAAADYLGRPPTDPRVRQLARTAAAAADEAALAFLRQAAARAASVDPGPHRDLYMGR